jgi:hypothetical protein
VLSVPRLFYSLENTMRRESKLYAAIDKHVPSTVYHASMTGATLTGNGILDRYYDGPKRDLWIEYKIWPSMPRDGMICVTPILGRKKQPQGRLSHQQLKWAVRRYIVGQNAFVVVGLPNRTALILNYPALWHRPVPVTRAVSLEEVSEWITNFSSK